MDTSVTIDGNYVDGVSITYGSAPRKHLWTYAARLAFVDNVIDTRTCPCKYGSIAVVPPFVGSDYYCESAQLICCSYPSANVLWEGQCYHTEALCCTHSNMPWFIKTLSETTTDDIELRICNNPILDLIELFVR